jgi:rubrerythrin
MHALGSNSRHSRPVLLRRTIVAGGTLIVGGGLVGRLARAGVSAGSPAQDVRVLNLALLLEYIESSFYADARAKGALRGELREFAEVVGAHEQRHLAFLKSTLGARARKKPKTSFGKATADPDAFVRGALALEDTVVAAYNGQATNLTPDALAAAAKIVSVEARHAAWIRSIAGKLPAADATDSPMSEAQVLAALRKTGFLRSS